MVAKDKKRMERSKRDKTYYIDSYYIRYLIYLNGYSYREIERKHRALLKEKGEQGAAYPVLRREKLRDCCEEIRYEKQGEPERSGPLPQMSEDFVNELCRFFQVEKEDICFSVEKEEIKWELKRKELREKRDEMIRESERLEELLIAVLKVCNIRYLSRISQYLTELLRTQTRHFWVAMEKELSHMEELLDSLNFNSYLGYEKAIEIGRIETGLGWSYPVKDEFAFQENEPLSSEIVSSLIKRQGMGSIEELANALSSDGEKIYRQRIEELIGGKRTGTPQKKKIARGMGKILHANWIDMKEENFLFWSEQGKTAVWETAEAQMRQAVRNLKPGEWRTFLHDSDEKKSGGEEEILLAIKNIICFSLCCYETAKSKELLEILEKRATENKAEEKTPETVTDALFRRCIRELKEEAPALTELKYKLLQNGLLLHKAFSDMERERLNEDLFRQLQERKRIETLNEFQEKWLRAVEIVFSNSRPWLLEDGGLTVTWINEEESGEPAILKDTIEVIIQLPRELDELLNPGEITASLPYEGGMELDAVINRNWNIICEAMDQSFGMDLDEWNTELYEEWKVNVWCKSQKVYYEDWEACKTNNKLLDQMIPVEKYGNQYNLLVEAGIESLKVNESEFSGREKDLLYELGIKELEMHRIIEKLKGEKR